MSKTIWKFELEPVPIPTVEMPKGVEVISVGLQDDRIVIWAIVDPGAEATTRSFAICGTGRKLSDRLGRFLGTVQHQRAGRTFVAHVFEVPES